MIRSIQFAVLALSLGLAHTAAARADIVTFEDVALTKDSYENGSNLTPPGSFTSGGATFNNYFDTTYGLWLGGWSYSNVVNTTTAGYTNQWAAFAPAGGDKSANYGVATAYSPGDATIDLAPGQRPTSMRVTNTTYAALSMQTGDQFAKKFGGTSGGETDFFKLTITGLSKNGQITGVVDFYLADFHYTDISKKVIVADWTTVDLSSLSIDTARLSFGLSSSDNDPKNGMNTPAYFAMDNLETASVPEPGSLMLTAAITATGAYLRRRRRGASF